jgi:hypothetical protein
VARQYVFDAWLELDQVFLHHIGGWRARPGFSTRETLKMPMVMFAGADGRAVTLSPILRAFSHLERPRELLRGQSLSASARDGALRPNCRFFSSETVRKRYTQEGSNLPPSVP